MSPRGARIYCGTPRQLSFLARRLRAGELVAVPTETVYGLAADAFNARACRRIFTVKGRPANDPLIVHIAAMRDLARVARPNEAARRLAAAFWPGPLTLVLPKTAAVPDIVSSGLPSVAVRLPAHPLFRRLLRLTGRPLAAPSANPFGYVSPTTAAHVQDGLGRKDPGTFLTAGPPGSASESDHRRPPRSRPPPPCSVRAASRIKTWSGCSAGRSPGRGARPAAAPRRSRRGSSPATTARGHP